MVSIAHFLTKTSTDYLAKADSLRAKDAKNPQAGANDEKLLVEFLKSLP